MEAISSVKGQMDTIQQQMAEDRSEAKRRKVEKKPAFRKKAHEKQYEFNQDLKEKLQEAAAAVSSTPPAIEKVKAALKEGEDLIRERQKLIKIADRSEHGWATVEEYVTDELADDSDDEKRLYKAESRAGRKVKEAKAKTTKKKPLRKYPVWPRNTFNTSPYGQINTGTSNPINTSQSAIQSGISKPALQSHSQALGPFMWEVGALQKGLPLTNPELKVVVFCFSFWLLFWCCWFLCCMS